MKIGYCTNVQQKRLTHCCQEVVQGNTWHIMIISMTGKTTSSLTVWEPIQIAFS